MPMRALLLLLVTCASGCSGDCPRNPSFPLKMADAKLAWKQMKNDPKPLDRPVIVLGGIYDPGIVAEHVAHELREIATPDAQVISLTFFEIHSFDHCAQKLIDAVDRAFPTDDAQRTTEVDVVAFSMGGLVARWAAAERPPLSDSEDASQTTAIARRLRIGRLFTISTPHRGAKLAWIPTFDQRVIDMRHDSAFLTALDAQSTDYQLIPYARLGDSVVGAENAAPAGRNPWWLAPSFTLSHMLAGHDVRILADIARRLRGEEPFTTEPAEPLPENGGRAAAPTS
jgi:hypothetical protein